MTTHRRNVLVTGGSRGIGRALAARMLARGDRVLVTARTGRSLADAAAAGLETVVCDVADPAARERLAAHVRTAMPELDLLVNNAGVQRRVPLAEDDAPWPERQAEIDTLLAAPVHLDHLLVPVMLAHGRPSAVVEVTSGGAVVPQPFAPVYSACKAALHGYTITLRHALAGTTCRVVELMPPAVATGLAVAGPAGAGLAVAGPAGARQAVAGPAGNGSSGNGHGAPLDDFADAALAGLDAALAGGPDVVGYGATAADGVRAHLDRERELFDALSGRFPVTTYHS